MDALDYRTFLEARFSVWKSEQAAAVLSRISTAIGVDACDLTLQRWGCHYYSHGLGAWLRQINYNMADDEQRLSQLPWERRYRVIRRSWEHAYDVSPRRLNWLSCHAITRPLFLYAQTTAVAHDTPFIHVCVEHLPIELCRVVSSAYLSTGNDLLHPRQVLRGEPPQVSKYTYDVDALASVWNEVEYVASRIADSLKLRFWHPDVSPGGGLSNESVAATSSMRARSLCFTLLPALADNCSLSTHATPFFYVIVPWRLSTDVVRVQAPEDAGMDGDLGNMVLVVESKKEMARIHEDALVDAVSFISTTTSHTVVSHMLGQERRLAGSPRHPQVNAALENAIRTLQHISYESLREVDNLREFRELLAKSSHKKSDLVSSGVASDDLVPLWGGSVEYREVLSRAQSLGVQYRNSWGVSANSPKVQVLFIYSPPGCGKESIWKILCAGACGDRDDYKHPSSKDMKAKESGQIEEYKKLFGTHVSCPFPLSSVVGVELRGSRAILFGETDGQLAGRLALMHCLRHPLFIDEFNTMDPSDADGLLRLLAQENDVLDKTYGYQIRIDIPIMFASNRSISHLVNETPRFNNALWSRFAASRGRDYFEIRPLTERPIDAVVAFCAMLLNTTLDKIKASGAEAVRNLLGRGIRVEPEALRLIAYVPWEHNYREMAGFVSYVADRESRRLLSRDLDYSITVSEMIQYLREAEKL